MASDPHNVSITSLYLDWNVRRIQPTRCCSLDQFNPLICSWKVVAFDIVIPPSVLPFAFLWWFFIVLWINCCCYDASHSADAQIPFHLALCFLLQNICTKSMKVLSMLSDQQDQKGSLRDPRLHLDWFRRGTFNDTHVTQELTQVFLHESHVGLCSFAQFYQITLVKCNVSDMSL